MRTSKSRTLALGFAVATAGLVTGCDGLDEGCQALLGPTPVQYVGHAFGKGEVELRAAEGRSVQGQVILRGESPEEPTLILPAVGVCRDGVARLRLAGVDHPEAKTRVLGGRLVLVHDADLLGQDFGMWQAEVMPKDGGKQRTMHGYMRERSADTAGSVAVR